MIEERNHFFNILDSLLSVLCGGRNTTDRFVQQYSIIYNHDFTLILYSKIYM